MFEKIFIVDRKNEYGVWEFVFKTNSQEKADDIVRCLERNSSWTLAVRPQYEMLIQEDMPDDAFNFIAGMLDDDKFRKTMRDDNTSLNF